MAQDENGLTSAELVAKLELMDRLLVSEAVWTTKASGHGVAWPAGEPQTVESTQRCIQGAAWEVTHEMFQYRQICMALHAAMKRPMVTLQEHEAGLSFPQLKDWLASAIDYAKNNEPWTPYLIEHPPRLR